MLPSKITPRQFRDYPPKARKLAVGRIELLRRLPPALAPLLLAQIAQYDWSFPAERHNIDSQLSYLASLSDNQMNALVSGFDGIKISARIEKLDWVASPGQFSDELSRYLWASGQLDQFSSVANQFMREVDAAMPPQRLPIPRLGIAIIGKEVKQSPIPLFRKLRPYGTCFTAINPANGLRILLDLASARAQKAPTPFGHWYIDGGPAEREVRTAVPPASSPAGSAVAPVSSPAGGDEDIAATSRVISYEALQPVRTALLRRITSAIQGGIGGPEALNKMLRNMRPSEIGLPAGPGQEVLSHFIASVFTNGQGTQIFSTTFVQWTARELWRRAQPLTILAHFTPRQRQRPMNELLSGQDARPQPDPAGSLIDADMGAYLMWIEQQRLAGAKEASFLVWFEDHSQALVVSPYFPRNTESNETGDMRWLLRQAGLL